VGTARVSEPRILARSEHCLSRKTVQKNALKVLYRLHGSKQAAYLVGGAVRDLLLARVPKDYDVATDARPQQIRRLFRNSRIIGRRFRLVHVYFREGIIEVSTFRRNPDSQEPGDESANLLITDDNVFGTPREDSFRRDFTINALFYDIGDYSVIDYVDGVRDLEAGIIRVIGDPDLRFREDPVRMMRACEIAGRLSFTLDSLTQEGIERHARELDKAAPARLTEELNQLMRCGSSARAMQWMFELSLAEVLLPEMRFMLEAERRGLGNFSGLFAVLDERVKKKAEFPEIGLLTSLLLPEVLVKCDQGCQDGKPAGGSLQLRQVASDVAGPFFRRFGLSKTKAEYAVQAILGFQQMRRRRWKDHERVRFSQRAYFDDAFFLSEAHAALTGQGGENLEKWKRIKDLRPKSSTAVERRKHRPRRRRQRPRARKAP
jgi:poly(A) polymerase